jgi:hypothetical protein
MGYGNPVSAKNTPPSAQSPFTYADIADLATPATAVMIVTIRSVVPTSKKDAAGPVSTLDSIYVEAQPRAVIRGSLTIPKRIAFLADMNRTAGAQSSLKGQTVILFARPTANPAHYQLVSSQGILPHSPATETLARSIIAEMDGEVAAPVITRIGEAFHVAGTLEGEGESQIFLRTLTKAPVSLSIVRRPGLAPDFGVALGEIVDEAAGLPARNTLLWYRLACNLPPALPTASFAALEPANADAVQADYAALLDQLGQCPRSRPRVPGPVLGNSGTSG